MSEPSEPTGDQGASRPSPPASAGVLCPFCGTSQPAAEVATSGLCKACRNRMDPMARIATHNAMGPWFVRDLSNPFAPGCSYETLATMCARGRVKLNSVVRGPTTQQFWRLAAHTPGVAVLLGQCHACAERVSSDAERCPSCEAALRPAVAVGVGRFTTLDDRQQLGLPPVRVMAEGNDPNSALDSLAQALGHAGSERVGVRSAADEPHAPARPGSQGNGSPRNGSVRLLVAGLLVALLLLVGLSLWAVVLPAMGVRTGVEEIIGLGGGRAETTRIAGSAARSESSIGPGRSNASNSVGGSERDHAVVDDDAASSTDDQAPPGVVSDDDDDEDQASATAPNALSQTEADRVRHLHRAALSGERADLEALRSAIERIATEALGERGAMDREFAERFPELAAMHAWADRAIADRDALDALGVR